MATSEVSKVDNKDKNKEDNNNKIDELILEIRKNSEGDEFTGLAVGTIFLARRISEIKKNLETGVYKTKQIEDLSPGCL